MIQKYFFIAIVFFSVSVSLLSCRQDDEATPKEENKSLSKPNIWEDEGEIVSRDSILPEDDETVDPPKNGTHWKSSDSLETVDPPKNGTHWKTTP